MDAKKRIVSKLEQIYVYLSELEEFIPKSERAYLQDTRARRACERVLSITIESVLDIVSIIIAEERFGFPESEENIIDVVERKKILSSHLAARIRNMKKFRNVLIHKYGELDNTLVYSFLTENLDDFKLFENEIKKYLKTKK